LSGAEGQVFSSLAGDAGAAAEGGGARVSPVMEAWLKNAAGDEEVLGPVSRAGAGAGAGAGARGAATDQNALKGLMEDVFEGDVRGSPPPPIPTVARTRVPTVHSLLPSLAGAFREYCAADPQWARAVAFLDQEGGAGWALLDALVNARPSARPAGGGGAAGKSLLELSDEEVAGLSAPAFLPAEVSARAAARQVPTARALLDSPFLQGIPRPWWLRDTPA
jgi:hypothetical protein